MVEWNWMDPTPAQESVNTLFILGIAILIRFRYANHFQRVENGLIWLRNWVFTIFVSVLLTMCLVTFFVNAERALGLNLSMWGIVAFIVGSAIVIELISEVRKILDKILLSIVPREIHRSEEE